MACARTISRKNAGDKSHIQLDWGLSLPKGFMLTAGQMLMCILPNDFSPTISLAFSRGAKFDFLELTCVVGKHHGA